MNQSAELLDLLRPPTARKGVFNRAKKTSLSFVGILLAGTHSRIRLGQAFRKPETNPFNQNKNCSDD